MLGNAESTGRMNKTFLWFIHASKLSQQGHPKQAVARGENEAETTFACSTLQIASLKSPALSPGAVVFLHRKFLSTAEGRLDYIRVNKHCRL